MADDPSVWTRMRAALRGPEPGTASSGDAAARPGRGLRALVWTLVGLAAVLLLVSSLTIWVKRQALDTDSWVATSGSLLENEDVRDLTASTLVDELFADGRAEAALEERLPEQLKPLAPQIAAGLQAAALDAAERLLALPQTQAVWEDVNREAHERLVAILEEEDGDRIQVEDGKVTLNLQPLVDRLGSRLGVEVDLPPDAAQVTLVESDDLEAAQTGVKLVKVLSVLIALIVLGLLALALWLARGFRRETLRAIGWSFVLVGVLILVARRLAGDAIIDSITTSVNEQAGIAIWGIGTELLRDIGWAVVAYGLAAVLAAWIAGPTRWATALRRAAAPTIRSRPWVAYGAVAAAFLLFLLWGPTGASQRLLGVVVLALLLALGVWLLRRQILREFPEDARPAPPY
jgi:hypothetical protein